MKKEIWERVECWLWKVRCYLWLQFYACLYVFGQAFRQRSKPTGLVQRSDKVVIVTGGLEGIGREITKQLLDLNFTVIAAGPDIDGNKEFVDQTQEKYGVEKAIFMKLNLASLASIAEFVLSLNGRPVHVLLCNAGVMLTPPALTDDGFDLQFGINYLGHVHLTQLLLPTLSRCGDTHFSSRVVYVSSCLHLAGYINLDDLNMRTCFSTEHGYSQSKLALVVHALYLQRRLAEAGDHVTANVVSPGVARTGLVQSARWYHFTDFGKLFFRPAREAAYCSVYAAASTDMEGRGGLYLDDCRPSAPNRLALDPLLQDRLWHETCKLLKIPQ